MEGFGVVQGGGDAAGTAGGEPANLHLSTALGRRAATCIGIKGEAIAAKGIISCDSVVWATSVVRRRSQGPLSPVADPFKSKPKPVPGTVPIFKFDEHPNMKPIVFAAFALSVAAVAQGVSLEIKPFKRLIPADRLRGE